MRERFGAHCCKNEFNWVREGKNLFTQVDWQEVRGGKVQAKMAEILMHLQTLDFTQLIIGNLQRISSWEMACQICTLGNNLVSKTGFNLECELTPFQQLVFLIEPPNLKGSSEFLWMAFCTLLEII